MLHIDHNTIARRNASVVPDYTKFAVRTLYRSARATSQWNLPHLSDALRCLVTHTPNVTESELNAVDEAIDALRDGLTEGCLACTALDVVDAAAEPLLADHRFDPTRWTSEVADTYLVDGGYELPEAPLGWSWVTCAGCAVPLPVQTPNARRLCDECLDARWNAA
ncbi:MAG: hypothetical protein KDB26_05640 [Microthrixaceae bacterium]|nr:hypothetical protein [Microthrixaceae bacterium]